MRMSTFSRTHTRDRVWQETSKLQRALHATARTTCDTMLLPMRMFVEGIVHKETIAKDKTPE